MECSGCKMMFVAEALASVSGGIYCSVCRDSTGGGDQVQSPRSVCTIDAFFEHERKMKEEDEIQQMENELEDLNRTLKKEQLRKALKEAHEKKEKLCEKETEVPKPVPEKKLVRKNDGTFRFYQRMSHRGIGGLRTCLRIPHR